MSINATVKVFSRASSTPCSPVSAASTRYPSSSSSRRRVSRASELSSTRRISCTPSTVPIARARQQPIAPAGSVSVRTLTARSPVRREGGAFGNPSSYVGTGVPATDRRAVGQTVRSGFPRPHPPHPPGGSAGRHSFELRHYAPAALPHIEDVAETVTDEVDGQHRGREKHAGKQDDPEGQLHVGAALRHDVAPGRDDGRRAGAEEGQIGLDEDGGSADVGALHEQRGDEAGQDVAQED